MDVLLIYLPASLAGRIPWPAPYLTFIPPERYYSALLWLTPLVFTAEWLLGAGAMHTILRLLGRPSDMDVILNLTGMATLVVGAFIVVWDWLTQVLGGLDPNTLGITHLVIDLWWWVLVVTGFKRLMGLPAWLGLLLVLVGFAVSLPLAVLFMRSPF